jgi:hypothetical protein
MGMIHVVIAKMVAGAVTEAYDQAEEAIHLSHSAQNPELTAKLIEAKDALFAARVLADEAANG